MSQIMNADTAALHYKLRRSLTIFISEDFDTNAVACALVALLNT